MPSKKAAITSGTGVTTRGRWDVYSIPPSFVFGFHGCDASVGEAVLSGKIKHLTPSENDYDWLGRGIYFWEGSVQRAYDWAEQRKGLGKIQTPFVIGAVINLGRCLDLRDTASLREVRSSYKALQLATQKNNETLPQNQGRGLKLRRLDCAVINFLHVQRDFQGLDEYSTVRADFWEGEELYPDSGFREQDHVQVCVRNVSSIAAYFRPLET